MDATNRQRVIKSVIPDAAVLIQDWERAANAGAVPMLDRRPPWVDRLCWSAVLLMIVGEVVLIAAGVRWLCGCW